MAEETQTVELKLAEALNRRKELMVKLDGIGKVPQAMVYQTIEGRIKTMDALDSLMAKVETVPISAVIAEFALYGHQLRLIDDAIQSANRRTALRDATPEMFCTYEERENPPELKGDPLSMYSGISIALALLRRKELKGLVSSINNFKDAVTYDPQIRRDHVADDVDNVTIRAARVTRADVVAQLNFYSAKLRMIDSVIQNANWTTRVEVDAAVMADFVADDETGE